jgi:hypothetical protein
VPTTFSIVNDSIFQFFFKQQSLEEQTLAAQLRSQARSRRPLRRCLEVALACYPSDAFIEALQATVPEHSLSFAVKPSRRCESYGQVHCYYFFFWCEHKELHIPSWDVSTRLRFLPQPLSVRGGGNSNARHGSSSPLHSYPS